MMSQHKTHIFIFVLLLIPLISEAQGLAAFHDNQEYFYIFDDGKFIEAEYLPVQSYRVGGNCILYIDNRGRLKMYYNGEISILEVNGAASYEALDNLAAYSFAGVVKIIEHGVVSTITTNSVQHRVEDNMAVFYDRGRQLLAAYYEGKVITLEDGLAGNAYAGLVIGDNIIAYVSTTTNELKAFYRGSMEVIEPYFRGSRLKAGKDVVAYIHDSDQSFRVYYNGQQTILEPFPPMAYQTGDGIVAYVDQSGSFKVFSNGTTHIISGYSPDFFRVYNDIVVYGDQGYFNTWYEDQLYTVENYIPSDWQAGWNSIVYRDVNGYLKHFKDGSSEVLTYSLYEEVQLYRDVIVVNSGMNNNQVFYEGQRYIREKE